MDMFIITRSGASRFSTGTARLCNDTFYSVSEDYFNPDSNLTEYISKEEVINKILVQALKFYPNADSKLIKQMIMGESQNE